MNQHSEQIYIQIHEKDNVLVALQDLDSGTSIKWQDQNIQLQEKIPVKHKFTINSLETGDFVTMYGVKVGRCTSPIPQGARISTENLKHATEAYQIQSNQWTWPAPDVSRFEQKTFLGYHRADGKVGTRNHWLVFPLVFCENRNIKVIEEVMLRELGFEQRANHGMDLTPLIDLYEKGADPQVILAADIAAKPIVERKNKLFPNVDGLKFLTHQGGCGGIRQDSEMLCRLLAGYLANPNVAGATVLSLGCQHAQISLLQEAIQSINGDKGKTVYFLEQQESSSEQAFIAEAVKKTFLGLIEANTMERKPAPLSQLVLGLECGGSDGFSGITANPALGHTSDLLVALGASTILSEFPELNGVEQALIDRCETTALAQKFAHLMQDYNDQAIALGSGFENNPSPGNIKDGLITDAIKSAGAAKKGGTSPVAGVLDYAEQIQKPGLQLLCTPGNDVESTTGLAGSGANMIVFTTGLGTPTGNPICPTIKFATNTALAKRMPDLIDLNAGTIAEGKDTIQEKGEELLNLIIDIASGQQATKAELLGQDDFIPWKRGISL